MLCAANSDVLLNLGVDMHTLQEKMVHKIVLLIPNNEISVFFASHVSGFKLDPLAKSHEVKF